MPPNLLKFYVSTIVGQVYRNFARETRIVFKGDGNAHRSVREKIKYMIRENPMNEEPTALANQVQLISDSIVKGVVQARQNPEHGSLLVELRRENVIGGRVNLPRIPNQTLFRSQRYVKEMFEKVKDHPNAEIVERES